MTDDSHTPAPRRRSRRRSAAERVAKSSFPVALRGYDRAAVDRYVADVVALVEELEANQTREGIVQRALDEVGEQTSGILQHAHDAAEEITTRSRSQAEGRIQRAEQEADELRREADRYAEEVVENTRRLWEERQRLIEDMRQLADEVLGVADDALERVEQPDTGFIAADPNEPPPTEVWEVPTEDTLSEDEPLTAERSAAEDEPPVEEPPAEGEPPMEGEPPVDEPPAEGEPHMEEPSADDGPPADEHATNEFEAPAARRRGR